MALTYFSGGFDSGIGNLAWPIGFALGISAFLFLQTLWKLKRNILKGIPAAISMVKVDRAAWPEARWPLIDDYGAQLVSRGFTHAGDYTVAEPTPGFVGVASIYFDQDGTTVAEIQHILLVPDAAIALPGVMDVHLSIASSLAGRVPVNVTDHGVQASHYLLGYGESVVASYPGLNLMALLEKHRALLNFLHEKTGQHAATGLNMTRYVLQQRERFDATRERITRMNGYQIATLVDEFEAAPRDNWSPPPDHLRALVARPLAEIEQRADAIYPAPVTDSAAPAQAAIAPQRPAITAEAAALKSQIDSYANWFYWIAGLSLVNALATMFGSSWGFAMGLGATTILSHLGRSGISGADVSAIFLAIVWTLTFGIILLFALFGIWSRRPSTTFFIVGIVLYVLDSLIFLMSGDWIGLVLHAVALFFLWGGFSAARKYHSLPRA